MVKMTQINNGDLDNPQMQLIGVDDVELITGIILRKHKNVVIQKDDLGRITNIVADCACGCGTHADITFEYIE